MTLIPIINYENYQNPNKNTYLREEQQGFIDMILNKMSVGGSLIGLPYLPGDSKLAVEIKLSEEAPFWPEKLDLKTLEEKRRELNDIIERLHLESPQKWPLKQLLKKLESIIENGGNTGMYPYGVFLIEPKPTVILYCGNIEKDPEPKLALEATLVHELFHAWDYCCCGEKTRTVPEIDEAIVEYATLSFLEKMSVADNLDFGSGWWKPHFREVFEWQLRSVQSEKQGVGLSAAYGFGEFIFNVDTKKEFMRVYPYVSGKLSTNKRDVKKIRGLMYPVYPYNDEKTVIDLIVKVINDSLLKEISVVDFKYPPLNPFKTSMTPNALFWDIINCGLNNYGKKSICSGVINSQGTSSVNDFHVPEPWNGNLSSARILFVSINPGYSAGELYPRLGNSYWTNSAGFDNTQVEPFFEGRFDSKNPYVKYLPGGHAFKILMENGQYKSVRGFWNYIFRMANVILPHANPLKDFAITELVHCKSKDASFITKPCYQRCMDKYLNNLFCVANNVEWVIFIGAPVRNLVCNHYGFSHPTIKQWYETNKLNGRNTKIVFTNHNRAFNNTGIIAPPISCPKI